MKATCNGFTGELVKLVREDLRAYGGGCTYNLEIRDEEKKVTYSFTGVKLSDIKFSGCEVSFGG